MISYFFLDAPVYIYIYIYIYMCVCVCGNNTMVLHSFLHFFDKYGTNLPLVIGLYMCCIMFNYFKLTVLEGSTTKCL